MDVSSERCGRMCLSVMVLSVVGSDFYTVKMHALESALTVHMYVLPPPPIHPFWLFGLLRLHLVLTRFKIEIVIRIVFVDRVQVIRRRNRRAALAEEIVR